MSDPHSIPQPLEPIPVILVNQDTDTIINAALLTTGLATLANAGPSGAGRSERETARLAGEECTIQGGIIRGEGGQHCSV